MMYSEFIEGTGCKDNEKNYKVFKNLEIMYMNSDMSKEEIYEYGKKLVDNSKSEKELAFEAEVKKEIEDWKQQIEWCKESIERYTWYLTLTNTIEEEKSYKAAIKRNKAEIKDYRQRINFLKTCLD